MMQNQICHLCDDANTDEGIYVNGELILQKENISISLLMKILREKMGINARSYTFSDEDFSKRIIEKTGSLDEIKYFPILTEMEKFVLYENK